MRSTSIGTRAASPSRRTKTYGRQNGFTLIEALVALAVILSFTAALGPLMFQSRHILAQGDGQVRAELLLRSLLDTPIERNHPELGFRDGESGGLRWSLDIEPSNSDVLSFDVLPPDPKKGKQPAWSLFRITARVFWGSGKVVSAETMRLASFDAADERE